MTDYYDYKTNAKPLTYFLIFRDSESARVIFPTFYESLDELIENRFKTHLFPVAFVQEMERLEIYKVPKGSNFTLYDYVDLKLRKKSREKFFESILSKFELKYVEDLINNKDFDKSWMSDWDYQQKWKEKLRNS